MSKQIEIFGPDDIIVKDILEKTRVIRFTKISTPKKLEVDQDILNETFED
jgi:hypothetical protein